MTINVALENKRTCNQKIVFKSEKKNKTKYTLDPAVLMNETL